MTKKLILVLVCLACVLGGFAQTPSDTSTSQMEKLDRGLVALKTATTGSYFLSWRLLGTDNNNTVFSILRDGAPYADGRKYADRTNLTLTGSASTKFQVVTWQDGVAVDTTEAVTPWNKMYMTLQLDRPAGGTISGWKPYDSSTKTYGSAVDMPYTYSPNDCSVGDVDGDGKPDVNIDTDGDGKPDINIDTDGLGEWKPSGQGGNADGIWKPDVNIDSDGDEEPDTNLDTNGDGKPDKNIDRDGDGKADLDTPITSDEALVLVIILAFLVEISAGTIIWTSKRSGYSRLKMKK